MYITVVGAGYVGLPSAALFANCGFNVTLLEINKERLETIAKGESFFYEEGLNGLLKKALKSDSLLVTDDMALAYKNADVVFSCVGTPDKPDGSSNLSYVFGVANDAAKTCKEGTIFVQKSTVPVGTGSEIEKLFKQSGKELEYVSNPEFLREGTSILDSLCFDRLVAGSSSKEAANKVLDIYKAIEENCSLLAKIAGIEVPSAAQGSYIVTNLNSAELIKVTANAFLALKISFANSIAKLADKASADVNEVMDGVGADRRIGRAFLNAGRGYGGGCFPKDVSGLISSAAEYGVDMPIMIAATDVNESMPGYIANKAMEVLGSLSNKYVAVLGLSFKEGTSDTRKSAGIKLANLLDAAGANVTVYDPHAISEAKTELRKSIKTSKDILGATSGTDAVFITTAWPELINIDLDKLKSSMSGTLLYDAVNGLDRLKVTTTGLQYLGVGRS